MCGGYWLREVNRVRSECADGTTKLRCYVARLTFPTANRGAAMRAAESGTLLVRGQLAASGIAGFPALGKLSATASWAGRASTDTTAVYEVRSTQIRCVADPCFTLVAFRVNTAERVPLSEIDLSGLSASARLLADKALRTTGLLARGKVAVMPDQGPAGDGRALIVDTYFQRL
jgi:hypothetical protein